MSHDLELLARWQRGERAAGNELLERHFHGLYRFFANKIDGDIDELVQATMLACVRSVASFRQRSSFKTYLFGIAKNQLYVYLRQLERDRKHLDFGVSSIADMGISPSQHLHRGQEHQSLLAALRSLPVDQQVLLELYYWEGLSIDELSTMFEIANTATRARLSRARRALRRCYQKHASTGTGSGDMDSHVRALGRELSA